MKRESYISVYKVTCTALTPLFIGSGNVINKYEYALNPVNNTAGIIHMPHLLEFIAQKKLAAEYERLIFDRSYKGNMRDFLEKHFSPAERNMLTLYRCDAGALYDQRNNPMDIKQFARSADGFPYVPGSALKGALCTCILAKRIHEDRSDANRTVRDMRRDTLNLDKRRAVKIEAKAAERIESRYFHTLNYNEKKAEDAVNSVMRTVSVSDSETLDYENMTLCRKFDIMTDGEKNKLNVARECLKPQTAIRFNLSLDENEGIGIDEIKIAVGFFYQFINRNFTAKFKLPPGFVYGNFSDRIILGGGTGYFSKTVMYNALDYDEARQLVMAIMNRDFPRGKHNENNDGEISPHTLKYTEYENKTMPFGICRITFE